MNKQKLKALMNTLEGLKENDLGQLHGGFSSIDLPNQYQLVSAARNTGGCTVTNNCRGGNCAAGCHVIIK